MTEQLRGVFDVAFIECLANVINDHCSDGFAAVRLLQQVAGQRGCRDFRDVLVLGDRGDFVLVETAMPIQSSREIMFVTLRLNSDLQIHAQVRFAAKMS